jgi:acetamidase/formamidase
MRDAVRAALQFLESRFAMPRQLAYAYLSAAADFEVSQVVDGVKGVHCLIRKADFEGC